MAAGAAAGLSAQEKEQLKEKLALLKREYSKTFHRLQRAERAVKVKNYTKKRVTEQNLFAEEDAGKHHEGGLSPEIKSEICSRGSTAEATPVLLKPEAFDGSLPETSGSRSVPQAGRRVLFDSVEPPPGRNGSLRSTRRTSGQRRKMLSLAKGGESVWEARQRDTGCRPEREMATAQGSGSPVFKRRSSVLETGQRSPSESSLPTSKGGNGDFTPQVLHPNYEQGTMGQTDAPGATQPLACVPSYASQVSLHSHLNDENISGLDDSAAVNIALHGNVQNAEKESVQMEKEHRWVDKEDPGGLAELAVTSDAVQGDKSVPGLHRNETDNGDPPSKEASGKGEGHNLEAGSPPLAGTTPSTKKLSNCTVVEGLMFPVEYYVRTTRRLSRCQKEVNVEAVIQSQLGKGRRGRRLTHKEQAVNPARSSQETPKCDEDGLSLPPSTPGDPSALSPCLSPKGAGPSRGHVRCRTGQRLRRRTKQGTSFSTCQEALSENSEGAVPGAFADSVEEFHKGKENGSPGSKAAVLTPAAAGDHLDSKRSSRERLEGPVPSASVSQGAELQMAQRALPRGRRSSEDSGELRLSARKPSGRTGDPRRPKPKPVQQGRRRSPHGGSQHPASPGLLRMDSAAAALPFLTQDREGSRLGWLPSGLASQEFHLPDEEFGHLKSKKLKVCPEKLLGICGAGGSGEDLLSTTGEAPLEEGTASGPNLISGMKATPPALCELLLSPALEGGQSLLQSPLPTPDFPLLGVTPASPALQHRECSPDTFRVSPLRATAAASPLLESGPRLPCSSDRVGISGKAGEEATSLEEKQLPAEKPVERDKEPPWQNDTAEDVLGVAPGGVQRESNLKMTSKLKNGSGSCLVDVSAVWWEAADFADLCVVTAEEASVSLWRPLDLGQWGTVHTWHFTEFPVIQIVPLPGAHSVVCVVLGRLETAEIRLLFHPSEDGCVKEQVVKAGNINAVLGLADRKLVSSCWSFQGQEVEVFSFSEVGRSNKRWALMPPEETVLAFADVANMQEALLGMTAMNCIVLWNLGTGQLLKKVPVGCSFPASVCHKAYSDSGLLFMVLSHPRAKESQPHGDPAFQIVALNPKTARSSGVMLLSLPPGTQGRYLERDVRDASAAAVLTSGTIAVWDLFLGQCTALLPPSAEGGWSLARWSVTDTCLLAGQEDGTVYLYSYAGSLQSG